MSPRRLRIAFVITELEVGGAEKCLVNLATGLDRARFEPVVISLGPRPKNDQLARRLEAAAISTHFLDLQGWRQIFRGLRRLTDLLDELQLDVVQTFLFHANVLGALAASRVKTPRLFAGARVADPRWVRLAIERWALWRAQGVVCVSEAVAQRYRRFGFSGQRLPVVSNGIDVDSYVHVTPADTTSLGIPRGQRTIVYVGRLDPQKGLDVLLTAAPKVLTDVPGLDLLLVGEGPERRTLKAQAEKLGKRANRVHFAGWRANIPAILKASEMLVLPSRWEGMPNVLLEAMAAGLPVVASDVEGVAEVLGPLAPEQTVPPGDVDALASRLVRLAQDAELRRRLGAANRERVAAEFSLPAMIRKYEELYTVPSAVY